LLAVNLSSFNKDEIKRGLLYISTNSRILGIQCILPATYNTK
jgi:hypothetical protein